MPEGKDFKINEFGEVVMLNQDNITPEPDPEMLLESEYDKLVYDLSHPERFSDAEIAAKTQRRAELHKILGKDKYITVKNGKLMDAAAKLREQLRAEIGKKNTGQLKMQIANSYNNQGEK